MTELDESITAADVTSRQLLQAVKGFLAETVTPALNDRDQFNARVAANVIGIVQREQALGPTLSALDSAAFKKWIPDHAIKSVVFFWICNAYKLFVFSLETTNV